MYALCAALRCVGLHLDDACLNLHFAVAVGHGKDGAFGAKMYDLHAFAHAYGLGRGEVDGALFTETFGKGVNAFLHALLELLHFVFGRCSLLFHSLEGTRFYRSK